jgi:hypothetical protein
MARVVDNGITATTNACVVHPCRPARREVDGLHPQRVINPITGVGYLATSGATGCFNAGDHVSINAAGTVVQILIAQPTVPMAGIALSTAAGAGTETVEIMPVYSDTEYIMNVCLCTHGISAAVDTGTTPAAVALLLGKDYEVSCSTVTYPSTHPAFYGVGGTVLCAMINLNYTGLAAQNTARVKVTGLVGDPTIISTSTLIPVYCRFVDPLVVYGGSTYLPYRGLQF